MIKYTDKLLALIVLLLSLAACQPGTRAATAEQSLPLTGARASVLGASALVIRAERGGSKTLLVPVSAVTGKPVLGYAPVDLGRGAQSGFSANRELLGFITYDTASCPKLCFHLLDLRAWKEILTPVAVGEFQETWTPQVVFDPQDQRAVFALNSQNRPTSQLVVIDLTRGKIAAQGKLAYPVIQLSITPAGRIAAYGSVSPDGRQQVMHVAALDGENLGIKWQQDLTDVRLSGEEAGDPSDPTQGRYLSPGVVFSPDGGRMYVVAADEPKLVTVDFDRQTVKRATIAPRRGLIDQLIARFAGVAYAKMLNGTSKTAVLSSDGKRLLVTGVTTTAVKLDNGDYQINRTQLGLQVIDTQSGTELNHLNTDADFLILAPDGKTLFLYTWPQTDHAQPKTVILNIATLQVTHTLTGEIHPSRLLNGEIAWLSIGYQADTFHMAIYPPGVSTPRIQWNETNVDYVDWLVVP